MAKSSKKSPKKPDENPQQLGLLFSLKRPQGAKRLTEHDYHKVGVERSIIWRGDTLPKNNKAKTKWYCKVCGHEWLANRHDVVNSGAGCPPCGRKRIVDAQRLTAEDYRSVGLDKGIYWLEDNIPESGRHTTLWGCSQEHIFETNYHNIKHTKYGCATCAYEAQGDNNRLTAEDYAKSGLDRGLKWVGKEVPHTGQHKSFWECSQGHLWETVYESIARNGYNCPYCSGNAPNTTDDYYELAQQLNLVWLGKELPKNSNTKTRWECYSGHVFERSLKQLRRHNGCPYCNGTALKTVDDYHELAMGIGYQWVGKELPQNSKTKTLWRCPNGHIWESTYNDFNRGTSCSHCQHRVNGIKTSSQQAWLCDLVAGEMNTYIEGYYIDITTFLDGVNIAIEYDGWHWHRDKLDEDAKRDADLIAAGWRVLRVKSAHALPDEQQVLDAIKRLLNGSTYEEIILDDWGE